VSSCSRRAPVMVMRRSVNDGTAKIHPIWTLWNLLSRTYPRSRESSTSRHGLDRAGHWSSAARSKARGDEGIWKAHRVDAGRDRAKCLVSVPSSWRLRRELPVWDHCSAD
jgi:hypothetical protein